MSWTSNRAVLLGDAAFATFGVGTTLAIQSAYFLAGELGKMENSEDIPATLQRYEEVFRVIQSNDEDLPKGFPHIAFPQTAWGLRVRDSIAWAIGKSKVYKLLPSDKPDASRLPAYEWVGV